MHIGFLCEIWRCGILWHNTGKRSTKVFSMKIIFFTNSRKFSPRTFPAIRYAQETIPQHLVSFQLALKTSANLATILPSSFYILFSILEPRPVASNTEMLALLLQLLNTTGCIWCHIYSHVVVFAHAHITSKYIPQ